MCAIIEKNQISIPNTLSTKKSRRKYPKDVSEVKDFASSVLNIYI